MFMLNQVNTDVNVGFAITWNVWLTISNNEVTLTNQWYMTLLIISSGMKYCIHGLFLPHVISYFFTCRRFRPVLNSPSQSCDLEIGIHQVLNSPTENGPNGAKIKRGRWNPCIQYSINFPYFAMYGPSYLIKKEVTRNANNCSKVPKNLDLIFWPLYLFI